jgi:hypothetical protein
LWHYAGNEPVAAITAAGYFNQVSGIMSMGDVVIIGATDAVSLFRVISNTNGAVALSALGLAA